MEISGRKIWTAALAVACMAMTGMVLAGCNGKAKQEAALAIDAARLNLADARKAKATPMVTELIDEAEGSLKRAERSFERKEFTAAKSQADTASMSARDAMEEAKKRPVAHKKSRSR